MSKMISQSVVTRAMNTAYEFALDGLPTMETAEELGDEYLDEDKSLEDSINSLIRWQIAKVSVSGFLSGLPGLFAAPATIPADLMSCLYVELRMAAAIAHMCGLNPRSDRVRSFAFVTLCGDSTREVLGRFGVEVGKKLTLAALRKLPGAVLIRINKAVGFRLLTKFGTKGAANFGKMVPLAGGIIGAAINAAWCNAVGNSARDLFMEIGGHKKEEDIECPHCEEVVTVCGEGSYECGECGGEFEYKGGYLHYEEED